MDILQFIKTRRSIRKFIDKPVSKNQIESILEAGRWAPSAGDCQPWRFVVVTDSKKIRKFDPFIHQPWVENAPAVITVLASPQDSFRRYGKSSLYYMQDCAAATQNMLLMAHGMGLGAVWVGMFSKDHVRKLLKVKPEFEVFALICVGHYEQNGKIVLEGEDFVKDDRRRRKSLQTIAFSETMESPWKK